MTFNQREWCACIKYAHMCDDKAYHALRMNRLDLVAKWEQEASEAQAEAAQYRALDEARHGAW